jgi:MFS family permease
MSPGLLRLVLMVSFAHALVHVYELALPSVEQLIAYDFGVGKKTIGLLATSFRLPFGILAVAVGWIVDRYGSRKILIVYLFGCGMAAWLVSIAPDLAALFAAMLGMGVFASMYHPAGLALISLESRPEERPRALAIHGVLGSAGIGGAPFLAGAVLDLGANWRDYYRLLALLGAGLGVCFLLLHSDDRQNRNRLTASASSGDDRQTMRWNSYWMVTSFATLNGFIYAAYLTFLPRYLDKAGTHFFSTSAEAERNYLSGVVLFVGMFGQYAGGRLARPGKLEPLLAVIALSSAPLLAAMAWVHGLARPAVAMLFALVHFMSQPVYNSLIAEYVPTRRRSLGYGFSFTMAFGLGSLGSTFAGYADTLAGPAHGDVLTYSVLAALAVVCSLIAYSLRRL